MYRVKFAGRSEVGRVRSTNEDSMYYSPDQNFCVIADGIGGMKGGKWASDLTVRSLRQHIQQTLPTPTSTPAITIYQIGEAIRQTLQQIHIEIREMGRRGSLSSSSGSTVAVFLVADDQAVVAHVGDSRIYRIRRGRIEQITDDHSISLRRRSVEPAADPVPMRRVLLKAIGTRHFDEPDIQFRSIEHGDVYVLCTDGISDVLDAEEIEGIVTNNLPDLEAAVARICTLANHRGGKDNLTVVLAVATLADAVPTSSPHDRETNE